MRRILLVEPGYRNKYPPLGLMKISNYHKRKGDFVKFIKGLDSNARQQKWDRIYISTLFTFYWDITVKTINYYKKAVYSESDIIVGGVCASLLESEIVSETGVTVIPGLLSTPGILDRGDKKIIDTITPDYQMLDEIDYDYGLKNAYIGYATRGCPNSCEFCAVSCIEPEFKDYLPLKRQVRAIEELYGSKSNLILLDNNVLASSSFDRIIKDIIDLGFEKGAKFNGRKRYVDFNQGIDIRKINENNMEQLSRIAISPMRLAFDHIQLKDQYIKCVRLADKYKIDRLSNYILYNFRDTPSDFYERLRTSVELNKELGTHIYSFPMKYIPLDAKDRSYIGPYWNKKLLRGVQCILLATRGKVGTNIDFFNAAFGKNKKEFIEIAMMPEDYIINRYANSNNGAKKWLSDFINLTIRERKELVSVLHNGVAYNQSTKISSLIKHYKKRKKTIGYY